MIETLGAIVILTFIAVVIYIARLKPQPVKEKPQVQELAGAVTILADGYFEGNNVYNIRTSDGGRSWWVIKYHENTAPSIIGRLEEIHPQVLRNSEAWERLQQFVLEKGPISLNHNKGVKLLQASGFEVRQKN